MPLNAERDDEDVQSYHIVIIIKVGFCVSPHMGASESNEDLIVSNRSQIP